MDQPKIKIQTPSLPKGGGASRGIGESFQPNEFSGTANLAVPVFTSPCRGFEPKISLSYSSGSGNSPWGLGFSIGTSSISRRTRLGTPTYGQTALNALPDVFILNGQELVPASKGPEIRNENSKEYSVCKYYPRQESSFSLIEFWKLTGTSEMSGYWKVTSREHVISVFGHSQEAQVFNPEKKDQIFTWLLEESYDTKGNHQLYKYKQENVINVEQEQLKKGHTSTAKRYLERIQYGNLIASIDSFVLNHHDSLENKSQWNFEVVFDYGEYDMDPSNADPYTPTKEWACRPDSYSSYHAGFEIRTYRRCLNVMMFHRFESELGLQPILVHATSFSYQANFSNLSECTSVEQTGYFYDKIQKSYSTATTPSTNFRYSSFQPEGHVFELITIDSSNNSNTPLNGLDDPQNYTLVDLFGEGLPGILFSNEQTHYYSAPSSKVLNSASPSFSNWRVLNTFPIQHVKDAQNVLLQDFTGNSKLDLVATHEGFAGLWEAQHDENWKSYQTFPSWPNSFKAQGQQMIDLTGDGMADLVQLVQDEVCIQPCLREKGYGDMLPKQKKLKSMPETFDSSPKEMIRFVDMAGSGQSHLVSIKSNKVTYWPNLSYGRFGDPIIMEKSPDFGNAFNTADLFMADLDGSGTADLIYASSDKVSIYFNLNGNSFSDPISINLPEGMLFDNLDEIRFSDIYGNGNACLILSELTASSNPKFWCYDFCQRKKPYILSEIDNSMGMTTLIAHKSSVQYYLEDKANGQEWITNLPFPVQVVSEITHLDTISNTQHTSRYSYHHGYYDGVERQFRGFGRVDRYDTEDFPESNNGVMVDIEWMAPVKTSTWYHTGAFLGDIDLRKEYGKEYFQEDHNAFHLPKDEIRWKEIKPSEVSLRQAYVAMVGMVLRTEVYGLDDEHVPYSTSENSFLIKLVQDRNVNEFAVFHTHEWQSLNYTYEQQVDDPLIHHSCVLKIDDYGNVEQNVSMAYPRRDVTGVLDEQKELKVLCSTSSHLNQLEPHNYLLGIPTENKRYHIKSSLQVTEKLLNFDEVKSAIDQVLKSLSQSNPISTEAQLLSWDRVFYWSDAAASDAHSFPYSTVSLPLLVHHHEGATFTQEELATAFESVLEGEDLKEMIEKGHYISRPDETGNMWWNPGLTQNYLDLDQFYLPKSVLDPVGAVTSYEYDSYHLLLTKTTDALGNMTQEHDIDYQHLQPLKLEDENGNFQEVQLDPLGRVIRTSHYGTESGKFVGFEPLIGAPILEFEQTNDRVHDIISHPEKYLGNAQSYFFYDPFVQPAVSVQLIAQEYPAHALLKASGLGEVDLANKTVLENEEKWHKKLVRSVVGFFKKLFTKVSRSKIEKEDTKKEEKTKLQSVSTVAVEKSTLIPQIHLQYYDGFGRTLCSKQKVEKGTSFIYDEETKTVADKQSVSDDRWITSGFVVYNNKAKPVRQYEPYFINTPDFVSDDILQQHGVSDTLLYDPLGRVNKVLSAKGFYTKHEWTPWEETVCDHDHTLEDSPYYKANVSKPDKNSPYYDERLTEKGKPEIRRTSHLEYIVDNFAKTAPKTIHDNMGHTLIHEVANNSPEGEREALRTYFTHNIMGRELTSADPRLYENGKYNFEHTYGLNGAVLKSISADGGTSWGLSNALGLPFWSHDSRGITIASAYDPLHRPLTRHVKKTGTADDPLELDHTTERMVYGDSPEAIDNPVQFNLRGKVLHHFDQAGLISTREYTILGAPLKSSRQFCKDAKSEPNWKDNSTENLQKLLQSRTYENQTVHDALGRVVSETDVDGNRSTPTYHLSGALDRLSVFTKDDEQTLNVVGGITYNAKGQRESIRYGNQTTTTYSYDPWTFELDAIQTKDKNDKLLQDLTYEYDPVGNVIVKTDNAQDIIFHNNQEVKAKQTYQYNALYQLIEATGRKKSGGESGSLEIPMITPGAHTNDNQALENYIEKYTYDCGGNLIGTKHTSNKQSWTRKMVVAAHANRAVLSTINGKDNVPTPEQVDSYFDAHGNQIKTGRINPLEWNYRDNLSKVTLVKREDSPSDVEYYVYDGGGNRVRKIKELYGDSTTIKETLYLGSLEIRQSFSNHDLEDNPNQERHSLRITDDEEAVATRDIWVIGKPPEGIKNKAIRYQLTDHLNSCTLEIDEQGRQISCEEYSPYGSSTLFIGTGSARELKNYRYGGKERDSATGYSYYGARYYAPWLGRWMSTDPAGTIDGLNVYAFVTGNPVSHLDVGGMVLGKRGSSAAGLNGPIAKKTRISHGILNKQANGLGEAINKINMNKLTRINANPADHSLGFFSKVSGKPGFTTNKKKFGRSYRNLWDAQDELISTSTVREIMDGVGKSKLSNVAEKKLTGFFDEISKIRFSTRWSGFANSMDQDGPDRHQHPTGKEGGIWRLKLVTGDGNPHSRLDLERKQFVIAAMEKNIADGESLSKLLDVAIVESILYTLNNFTAPAMASDQHPLSKIDKKELEAQTLAREKLKKIAVNHGAMIDPGTQAISSPWKGRKYLKRSLSQERLAA